MASPVQYLESRCLLAATSPSGEITTDRVDYFARDESGFQLELRVAGLSADEPARQAASIAIGPITTSQTPPFEFSGSRRITTFPDGTDLRSGLFEFSDIDLFTGSFTQPASGRLSGNGSFNNEKAAVGLTYTELDLQLNVVGTSVFAADLLNVSSPDLWLAPRTSEFGFDALKGLGVQSTDTVDNQTISETLLRGERRAAGVAVAHASPVFRSLHSGFVERHHALIIVETEIDDGWNVDVRLSDRTRSSLVRPVLDAFDDHGEVLINRLLGPPRQRNENGDLEDLQVGDIPEFGLFDLFVEAQPTAAAAHGSEAVVRFKSFAPGLDDFVLKDVAEVRYEVEATADLQTPSRGGFTGDDIHQPVPEGPDQEFTIRQFLFEPDQRQMILQNDSAEPRAFRLKSLLPAENEDDFSIRFLHLNSDVTQQVTTGGFLTELIAPGDSLEFTVEIEALRPFTDGGGAPLIIQAFDLDSSQVADSFRIDLVGRENYDLLARKVVDGVPGPFLGDGPLPASLGHVLGPEKTLSYEFSLENDAAVEARAFKLVVGLDGGPGDLRHTLTRPGQPAAPFDRVVQFETSLLQPGESEAFTIEVKVDEDGDNSLEGADILIFSDPLEPIPSLENLDIDQAEVAIRRHSAGVVTVFETPLDLFVDDLVTTLPDTLNVGDRVDLDYFVRNLGESGTFAEGWTDLMFLDVRLDPNGIQSFEPGIDIPLGHFRRIGSLDERGGKKDRYNATIPVTIPAVPTGTYRFRVETNHSREEGLDINRQNNFGRSAAFTIVNDDDVATPAVDDLSVDRNDDGSVTVTGTPESPEGAPVDVTVTTVQSVTQTATVNSGSPFELTVPATAVVPGSFLTIEADDGDNVTTLTRVLDDGNRAPVFSNIGLVLLGNGRFEVVGQVNDLDGDLIDGRLIDFDDQPLGAFQIDEDQAVAGGSFAAAFQAPAFIGGQPRTIRVIADDGRGGVTEAPLELPDIPIVDELPQNIEFAGNVTLELIGDVLTITGDAENNAVAIHNGVNGIEAVPVGGTTINGSLDPVPLNIDSFTTIRTNGGDGNDSFLINGVRVVDADLSSTPGDDLIVLDDVFFDGNLTINVGPDEDVGTDNDRVRLNGVTVVGTAHVTTGRGADTVEVANSTITGDSTIVVGDGNDIVDLAGAIIGGTSLVIAGNGDDQVTGSDGDDEIQGGDGNDQIVDGHGDDVIDSGPGDDVIALIPGSTDTVTDPSGNDTLDFSRAEQGITIDLDAIGSGQTVDVNDNGLMLNGGPFENLIGSPFDDTITVGPIAGPRMIDGGDDQNGDVVNVVAGGLPFTRTGNRLDFGDGRVIDVVNGEQVADDTAVVCANHPPPDGFAGVGNVAATLTAGDLIVRGDTETNGVAVFVDANGDLVVVGLAGTTVNGSADPFVAIAGSATVPGDLRFFMGRGDDFVCVDGITVGDDASASLNSGNDTLVLTSSVVGDDLHVHNGQHHNKIVLSDVTVDDRTSFVGGSRGDDYIVESSELKGITRLLAGRGDASFTAADSEFGDDLWTTTLGGTALLDISSSQIADDLRIVHASSFPLTIDMGGLTVGGSTSVFGSSGDETIAIADSEFRGRASFSLRRGSDDLVIRRTELGNRLWLTTSAGDDTIYLDTVNVAGSAVILTGTGHDVVQTRGVVAAGSVTLLTGSGNDAVLLDGATISNKLIVRPQSGNDVVDIQATRVGGNTSIAKFAGSLLVRLTRGNTFTGRTTISGAPGDTDTLIRDDTSVFAQPPTLRRFEDLSNSLLDTAFEDLVTAGFA